MTHGGIPCPYTKSINQTKAMQVYVVTAHDLYEQGVDVCALYMNESDANARAAELQTEFDVVEVNLQTVH